MWPTSPPQWKLLKQKMSWKMPVQSWHTLKKMQYSILYLWLLWEYDSTSTDFFSLQSVRDNTNFLRNVWNSYFIGKDRKQLCSVCYPCRRKDFSSRNKVSQWNTIWGIYTTSKCNQSILSPENVEIFWKTSPEWGFFPWGIFHAFWIAKKKWNNCKGKETNFVAFLSCQLIKFVCADWFRSWFELLNLTQIFDKPFSCFVFLQSFVCVTVWHTCKKVE